MFLGFDVGNTSTVMGLYHDDESLPFHTFRYPTDKKTLSKSLLETIDPLVGGYSREISAMALSSVVPEINNHYSEAMKDRFGVRAHVISHQSILNIRISYPDPTQLGVDRIVNAEAAFVEYGGNNLIIDIGTAATFCVVLENGLFDGGIIAPGIGTTIRALAEGASNLPEVPFEAPDRLVARDTINALKSGFYFGWISLVEGLIWRIRRNYDAPFRIILTGGFASVMGKALEGDFVVDRELTMKGIHIIGKQNCF